MPPKKKNAPKPKAPAAVTCLLCKKEEAPDVPGATYSATGENGMLLSFWMCDQCAIPLGPGQGPIDIDDPTLSV
jgi:hypothetical protein